MLHGLLLTINISDIGAMHIGLGALERRKLDLKSRMDFWAGFIRPRSYVRTSPRLLGDMQRHQGGLQTEEVGPEEQDGLLGRSCPAAVLCQDKPESAWRCAAI